MAGSLDISRRTCLQMLGAGAAVLGAARWHISTASPGSAITEAPLNMPLTTGAPLFGRRNRTYLQDWSMPSAAAPQWQGLSPDVSATAREHDELLLMLPDGERLALSMADFQCGRALEYLRARFGDDTAQRIGDSLLKMS